MDLEVTSTEPGQSVVENVEVVTGEENVIETSSHTASTGLMEQHIIVTHPQELMTNSEVQIETQALTATALEGVGQPLTIPMQTPILSMPVDPTSPEGDPSMLGMKRAYSDSMGVEGLGSGDVPRKKSRNYLDSHKSIEKKRRDRINACLNTLKAVVPDCRQYGNKKLDKAEILEMTIEYVQRMQAQGVGKGGGGFDSMLGQRDWASDLTTWIIQNKLLYTGPNSLDQFCQALILHLQSFGSQGTLASAANLLLNQTAPMSEEDPLLRQQAQAILLQHLQQQSPPKVSASSSAPAADTTAQQQQQLAQAQLTQLQALLLLQQHQQLLSQQQQQQQEASGSDSQAQQLHLQLQQIQQLQALLLQHIANEAQQKNNNVTSSASPLQTSTSGVQMATATTSTADSLHVLKVASSILAPTELASTSNDTALLPAEETVYTSAITNSLEENLLQVNVNVNQPDTQSEVVSTEITGDGTVGVEVTEGGQMWSSGGDAKQEQAGSSLLILGGGEEGGKDQVIVEGDVQEEVVLLTNQEQ